MRILTYFVTFLMQKIDLKPHYDVTVIGSGVGGLTAAALLSKAGLSVCVLEMADHSGGYLAGFRRKHFIFDTAIHWLNQCAPGGMACKIFDILGSDHPVVVSQKRIRRLKGDSFDYLLTNNPDDFRDQLIREFPEDKDGIISFFKAAKKIGRSFANFSSFFRTEETMTFYEKMANKRHLLKFALPFIPFIGYEGEEGIKKGLSKYFKNKKIHDIFSSETGLLSCLVPIGWAYYGDFQSPPKGGGQAFPHWLEHIVKYFKNDIYYKCRVKQILLDGNTAKGVRFECRGVEYEVHSKYVIPTCDVETLYEKMLPPEVIPEKMKQRLRAAEIYGSSVTLSIALDCPTAELGFNEEAVHLASEGVPRHEHHGGDPKKSELIILPPSLRDKSLAPAGMGTLVIFMPAEMSYEQNWRTHIDENGNYVRNEEYNKLKHEIAEILINRVEERLVPGLRKHILFYDIATPVTHHRYTGNKNGTMMGAKPGRTNMQAKIAHYRTPIKNMILGGHWAELGGGVPIAVKAGANASLLVLQHENKKAFKLLAGYMDGKITAEEVINASAFKTYDNSWVQPLTPAEKLALRTENELKPRAEM